MIVETICNILCACVLGAIGLFPTIPQIDTSFLSGFFRVLSTVDAFVSLKVVSACFVIIFLFMNIQVIWSLVMWVMRKIPGIK